MATTGTGVAGSGATVVAVSIHNARDATAACLESLERHTPAEHRLLLLDDASTDPLLRPMLERFARLRDRVEVHASERNLGYTGTVNRGCELAAPHDVVLLNSDTEVTPGWLGKLERAAASRPRVATVTPLSNAAGAFSVPERGRVNRLPRGMSADAMAALVEELAEPLYPEVPTGNGYCLFLRREALDAVGLFDDDAFAQGCGEENDLCMRARAAGFVHLIDDATFIYHRRSASLGLRKRWLVSRAQRRLARRYPEYRAMVAAWLDADPVDGLRHRLRRALAAREAG